MMRRAPRPASEAPRPPGWTPPPQPPPGPAAPRIACAPPAPVRPAPKPAARPVPPPAQRSWLFPWLTFWFVASTLSRAEEVVGLQTSGIAETTWHFASLASVGAAAVLTIGLWRGERWLPRAAALWAATVVVRYTLEFVGLAGQEETHGFLRFAFMCTIPVATAMYIQHRARELGLLS